MRDFLIKITDLDDKVIGEMTKTSQAQKNVTKTAKKR